jgi:hypothetical protein
VKDFVFGLGQLLVERTTTTSAPLLASTAPIMTGNNLNFGVTDPGGTAYDIDIQTDTGYAKQITNVTPDSGGLFSVDANEVSSGVPNRVRIRRHNDDAEPYSDPVTVTIDPTVAVASAKRRSSRRSSG